MSQTNLPMVMVNVAQSNLLILFKALLKPLPKHLPRPKRANISLMVLLLMTVFVSACSTQSTTKKTQDTTKTITKKEMAAKTADEKLALAQSLNAQQATVEQPFVEQQQQINTLLVESSELFLQQKNFSKALKLADKTAKLGQKSYTHSYRLLLVKAGSLQALNYYPQAYQQLQLARELVSYTENEHTIATLKLTLDYYLVLQKVLTVQGKKVPALTAQMNAFALNSHAASEDTLSIWRQLETLTQWQSAQLIKSNPPFIEGWQQLLSYSHKFGANAEQYSRYLRLWQQQNPTHPATSIIEQLQTGLATNNSAENTIENIAVLLPLSGNQKNAGLAAQQGVLAAYNNNAASNIHFIDTNNVDFDRLATQVSELQVDHIIGPLLRTHVESFLAASVNQTALQIPTLLLNLPSKIPLTRYQAALSMRPEDEAVQAAATLSKLNYNKPIILSYQDRVSKRIAHAFSQQWQISTGDVVDIVYFNQGKAMQANLKESLDINTSQTRIKQLNRRLKNTIKAEPRNRRDIDMIYLVGSAAQTRLIKPYIDVNTSPFADIIPVYASSRSHSNFNDKNSASSTNDLQGLTFTQMPWLFNSKQQNKSLAKLSDQLWPKRTDSLSKIFAMGFDSYNLLGKVALMKQAPYIRHFGQTGVLKLNNKNILTRSLIWGQYKNDKVIEIAMD